MSAVGQYAREGCSLAAAISILLVLCSCWDSVDAQAVPTSSLFTNNQNDEVPVFGSTGSRRLESLVQETPLILTYHNGPILSGQSSIPIYIIWYGTFMEEQRSTIRDFISSLQSTEEASPSVSSWWKLTGGYKDADGASVTPTVTLAAELSNDGYSHGKVLNNSDLEDLVVKSLDTFPASANAIYLVLTASDVEIDDFCTNSCASHLATGAVDATKGQQLPFAWVGNAAEKCPGKCAWPFAKAEYGPDTAPLVPPNADVAIDGMVINIASMLAGIATNPFDSGYYQGDGAAPLEAATACAGIFGEGSFTGYPGQLQDDKISGASFNAHGIKGRRFLLPAIWDPATLQCTPPPSL